MNYREILWRRYHELLESAEITGAAPISLTEYRARRDRERWRQKYQSLGVGGRATSPPSSPPTTSGGR